MIDWSRPIEAFHKNLDKTFPAKFLFEDWRSPSPELRFAVRVDFTLDETSRQQLRIDDPTVLGMDLFLVVFPDGSEPMGGWSIRNTVGLN